MKIIGITGTIGAGKGTVVDYLVKNKGFKHFSAREFLVEEMKKRGIKDDDRPAMRLVANDLRRDYGPAYVIQTLFERASKNETDAIIESIRTVGEADFLKQKGALIIAVDADRRIRYERAVERGSSTDNLSFEEFCAQEDREMSGTEPWDMNISAIMKNADYVLTNNKAFEDLYEQTETMLTKIVLK